MLGSMGSVLKGGVGVIGAATATIAAGTVAAGKAFAGAAQDVSSYGDNIDKMSQKIGISAQSFQEWDYVFQRSGADISKLQTGMKTLSGVIADAGNGKSSVTRLEEVERDVNRFVLIRGRMPQKETERLR